MARRKEAHGGGHGWFVTFADLMGLLVSFFVMLVAFSNQDSKKVQAVAGSMREAFGVQKTARYSGIMEVDGLSRRFYIRNAAHISPEDSSVTPTPDQRGAGFNADRAFSLATASLRQALHDMPELNELSKHIIVEETKEGLDIHIVDQDGRSMFPEGSTQPYERTRTFIQKLAAPLKAASYRISITGHTSRPRGAPPPENRQWNLSVGRAIAVRRIFEEEGYPPENFSKVAGKAATDPIFPDDPSIAANRRVTITLLREAPPLPPDLHP